MAIKLSGSTIINDNREVINSNFVGVGTTAGSLAIPFRSRSSVNIQGFFESTDPVSGIVIGDSTGTIALRTRDTGDFTISTGGNIGEENSASSIEALRILGDNQYVGIGTDNPTNQLEVHSTSATVLKIQRNSLANSNTGIEFSSPDGSIHIGAKDGGDFSIASTNNLTSDSIFNITSSGESTILCNGTSDALRITNSGSGNSFIVEDEASDLTPFVITSIGRIGISTNDTLLSTHVLNAGDLDNGGTSIGYRYYGFTGPSANIADCFRSEIGAGLASTTGQVRHFLAQGRGDRTGGSIGKLFGFFAASGLDNGTENYGFYSDITSGTNNFNFYAEGDAVNYFSSSVGIGTTTPLEDIHIFKSVNEGTIVRVENRDPGSAANASLRIYADTPGLTLFAHGSGRGSTNWGVTLGGYSEVSVPTGNGLLLGTKNASDVIIGTNDENRITVRSNGNVGIGSVIPAEKFVVQNSVAGQGILLTTGGVDTFPRFTFDSARSGNGQAIGQIVWDNSGTQQAQLRAITGQTTSDEGQFEFLLRRDGSTFTPLRISSAGQFHLHDDVNTYIDRPAEDEIALVAGGLKSLFLRSNGGQVATGIGTSVPTYPIEIYENNATLIKAIRPGVNAGISLESSGGSISFGADVSGNFSVNTGANLASGAILTSDRSSGNLTISGNLIVSSGNGIDFSATADGGGSSTDSELLDDYEEGQWTPTYGGTTGDGSCTYDIQNGYYTKIGNTVYFSGRLRTDSIDTSPSGFLTINGLPYTIASGGNQTNGGGYVVYFATWDSITNNPRSIVFRCISAESRLRVHYTHNSTTVSIAALTPGALHNAANSNDLQFAGFYFTSVA